MSCNMSLECNTNMPFLTISVQCSKCYYIQNTITGCCCMQWLVQKIKFYYFKWWQNSGAVSMILNDILVVDKTSLYPIHMTKALFWIISSKTMYKTICLSPLLFLSQRKKLEKMGKCQKLFEDEPMSDKYFPFQQFFHHECFHSGKFQIIHRKKKRKLTVTLESLHLKLKAHI